MARREAALGSLCGLAIALGAGLLLDPVLLDTSASPARAQAASTSEAPPTPPAPSATPPPPAPTPAPSSLPSRRLPSPPTTRAPDAARVVLVDFVPPTTADLSLEIRALPRGALRRVSLAELQSLRLDPGRYEFRLLAPGFVTPPPQLVSVSLGAKVLYRPPPLRTAYVLRGRLAGPSHLTLRRAELDLRALEGDASRRLTASCTPAGEFAQGGLPEGRYRVRARVEDEGQVYLSAWAPARVGAALQGGLSLRLQRAEPALEGRVFDHRGTPVAGATLRVANEETQSDDEGSFRLYGHPPGSAWLEVEAEGFLKLRRSVVLGTGTGVDLDLRPVSVVTGRLSDDGGRPLSGSRVVLFQFHGPETHTSQSVVSDAEGRFRFEPLLPGSYALGDDPAEPPLSQTFELGPGQSLTLSLRAREPD